jgi:hypothetical protein
MSSTTGTSSGSPLPRLKRHTRATSNSRVIWGSPSSIRQILAVVPPMSKASTRGAPAARACWAAAAAPPAGPDSTSRIGTSQAVSTVQVPPLDSISSSWPSNPSARKSALSARR